MTAGGKGHAPSFTAARLFKKTSASGNEYFTGRLGGVRVSLLKSKEVAEDGGEIWSLMFAEAPSKPTVQRPLDDKRDYQKPPAKVAREVTGFRQTPDDPIPF